MVRPTLDRFLVVQPKPAAPDALSALIQQAGADHSKKRQKRKATSWSKWTEEQKRKCCAMLTKHGYRFVRNAHGADTPPASTIRTWTRCLVLKGRLRVPGRPRWLTAKEEEQLYQSVISMRRHGCIVDRETLVVMAQATVRLSRGEQAEVLPITVHWCKAFRYSSLHPFPIYPHRPSICRKRFQIGRLRKPSTERPPLTADNWQAVNEWRAELLQLQRTPADFGIGIPAGWSQGVPDEMVIGVDETPLHYVPGMLPPLPQTFFYPPCFPQLPLEPM